MTSCGGGGLPRGAEKAESFVAEGGGWGRKEEVAKTETPMLERRGRRRRVGKLKKTGWVVWVVAGGSVEEGEDKR